MRKSAGFGSGILNTSSGIEFGLCDWTISDPIAAGLNFTLSDCDFLSSDFAKLQQWFAALKAEFPEEK